MLSPACVCHSQQWNICCCTSEEKAGDSVLLIHYAETWQRSLSCQGESHVLVHNKFRSIYEQISLVNMTGNQQSVNICYYLLIMPLSKFMAADCWHICMKIHFPQLTACSFVERSAPFVNARQIREQKTTKLKRQMTPARWSSI